MYLTLVPGVQALARYLVWVLLSLVILSFPKAQSTCKITMSKREGVKTVVIGGKKGVSQQYCGTVGGQSTGFTTIDTELKVRIFPYYWCFGLNYASQVYGTQGP